MEFFSIKFWRAQLFIFMMCLRSIEALYLTNFLKLVSGFFSTTTWSKSSKIIKAEYSTPPPVHLNLNVEDRPKTTHPELFDSPARVARIIGGLQKCFVGSKFPIPLAIEESFRNL